MSAGWADQKVLALDTETSGVRIEEDRIASACAAIVRAGAVEYQRDWLIAVDVEMDPEATRINGLTNGYLRENGIPAAEAIPEIANAIRYAVHSNMPIVAFNASFDLTLIDRECRRWIGQSLAEFCGRDIAPVIDVYVLWKAVDKYRKGSRKLTVACEVFGVDLGEKAHEAAADAIAATRVAHRIAQQYPNVGNMALPALHAAQVAWRAEQQTSLAAHFRKQAAAHGRAGDSEAAAEFHAKASGCDSSWPIKPYVAQGALL